MPHTNRKKKSRTGKTEVDTKKKFSHSKREYINSNDGWTHVADKRWGSAISKDPSAMDFQILSADITLEEMVKEHERYKQQWENSDACAQLLVILSNIRKEEKCPVENVVCLGLGSLQALPMEWRRSSHTQLAALMTIRDCLDLKSQVIMQEPRFTDLDSTFLGSIGCVVVNHPEAFDYVTQNSLIYAIHCPYQLLWKVKEKVDPILLIMNGLQDVRPGQLRDWPEDPDETGTEFRKLQQTDEEKEQSYLGNYEETYSLVRDCEDVVFPQLRNDFCHTMIYWRKSTSTVNSGIGLVTQEP